MLITLEDYEQLLKNGKFWITFKVEGDNKIIKAHKCILSARSPIFSMLLSGQVKFKLMTLILQLWI